MEEKKDKDKVASLKKCFEDITRHTGIVAPVSLEKEIEEMIVNNVHPHQKNVFIVEVLDMRFSN